MSYRVKRFTNSKLSHIKLHYSDILIMISYKKNITQMV